MLGYLSFQIISPDIQDELKGNSLLLFGGCLMEKTEKEIIIKDGCLNWICLASDCESNCCSGDSKVLEELSKNNLASLLNLPKHTIPITDENYAAMKNHDKDKIVDFGPGGLHINQSGGECVFLCSDGRCSIHNNRGSSCRSYPFFIDKYTGLSIDISCPGIGKGWTSLSEIIIMVDELKKVYEHQFKLSEIFLNSCLSNSNK